MTKVDPNFFLLHFFARCGTNLDFKSKLHSDKSQSGIYHPPSHWIFSPFSVPGMHCVWNVRCPPLQLLKHLSSSGLAQFLSPRVVPANLVFFFFDSVATFSHTTGVRSEKSFLQKLFGAPNNLELAPFAPPMELYIKSQ